MRQAIDGRNIVHCKRCMDVLESNAPYTVVTCVCGSIQLIGGREYQSINVLDKEDLFVVDTPD